MILDVCRSSQIDSSSVSSLERMSKDLSAEGTLAAAHRRKQSDVSHDCSNAGISLTIVGVSSHLRDRMGSLSKIGVATVSEAIQSFSR
jgi:hypothetical protein